jgi:carboxypeptidase A4
MNFSSPLHEEYDQEISLYVVNQFSLYRIHAREWISSAVATYIVNELTHNSEQHDALLKRYDFYIIPLLNPDGYAYSVNYNRFWRKSRREVQSVASWFGCRGVDLNRNFGYNWGGRGSGRQACSLVYGGTEAFSEPESASIRDFVEQHSEIDWVAYFSLHAFGQKWMTPWGNTREVPDDYDELIRVGQIGVEALRAVHGTRYRLGSSSNIMCKLIID